MGWYYKFKAIRLSRFVNPAILLFCPGSVIICPESHRKKHWHMVNIPSQDVCVYNACNAAFSLPHVGYSNLFQTINFQSLALSLHIKITTRFVMIIYRFIQAKRQQIEIISWNEIIWYSNRKVVTLWTTYPDTLISFYKKYY